MTLPRMVQIISSIRQKQSLVAGAALTIITLIGAGLRFYRIGSQPLWLDEAFSVWMGSHSIADIIRLTIDIDQHPPVYHILLHIWMAVGGSSEFWVRSFSALLGIFTIIVIYFFGKTVGGKRVGIIAAFILAFSPFHVQFSQESRAYSLLTFCAGMAMWMTAVVLTDRRAYTNLIGQTFLNRVRGRKFDREALTDASIDLAWLGYMFFTAMTVYGHNTAVLFPFAVNLFVLGLMIYRRSFPARDGQLQPPSFRNWWMAQIGVLLFLSPWIIPFIIQMVGVVEDFWIQPPTLEVAFAAIQVFLFAFIPERIQFQQWIWAALCGLLILSFVRYQKRQAHFYFLGAMFLTPFLGELLASLWRPIFYDRTLIWCTLPLYILIAAGISQLRFRSYTITALLILVTISALSLANYYNYYEKERWDLAARYVVEKAQPGDIMIFNAGWAQIPFDYYYSRYNHPIDEIGAPDTMFENGVLEPKMTENDVPRLQKTLKGRTRVWLIYSHNWWTDPKALIQKTLRKNYKLIDIRNYSGMQIQLYGTQK